jgi:putative membrane protein
VSSTAASDLALFATAEGPSWVLALPTVNALLNTTSALLLSAGWMAIRRRKVEAHTRWMLAAFITSSLFLVSYLTYHYAHGSTRYQGEGWLRQLYFAVLISHTILAIVVVPLVLRTLFLAWRGRLASHRRLARWTLPLWLYVSVTGVVVYLMLYRL